MIGVALAACSSSTHLDPPGASATGTGGNGVTTTSATTGSSGGTGGAPAMECRSNPECATFPYTVCDTVSGTCRQCLLDSDCTLKDDGPVCAAGKCGCPQKGDVFCGAPGVGQCVNRKTAQTDCGHCGHACFGACTMGVCADPWEPTSLAGAPDARSHHVAVWDVKDSTMIVWGGRTAMGSVASGGIYNPATNTWTPTSLANAPSARVDATAIWDNNEKAMIVWGGRAALGSGPALGSGALYYPASNVWKTLTVDGGTPSPRWGHTAVWTGMKMIVWGGTDVSGPLGDGGTFDPTGIGSWVQLASGLVPTVRTGHVAVWTGDANKSMFVWGGFGVDPMAMPSMYLADGGVFDFQSSMWQVMVPVGTPPTARTQATAVWTGMSMLIWGGTDGASVLGDGGRYRYVDGTWSPFKNPQPAARSGHSAAWIKTPVGDRMMVWGGVGASGYLNSGAMFDDTTLIWAPALATAPAARAHHSTVITGELGSKMIIWGGDVGAVGSNEVTSSGAIFDALAP